MKSNQPDEKRYVQMARYRRYHSIISGLSTLLYLGDAVENEIWMNVDAMVWKEINKLLQEQASQRG